MFTRFFYSPLAPLELTERDEFAFHEMMAHMPICSHPNPKSVCRGGGGDSGVLRQVIRHKNIKRITVVEIDPMVINVAKKFFGADQAFRDSRVEIVQQDGAKYIANCANEYDVIISDSNDPLGPAESLFEPAFYENMYHALSDGGVVCIQAESFWIHLDLISDLVACSSEIFDHAEYASTMVPTYPCGQIGFILAGKNTRHQTCHIPLHTPDCLSELKWYNPQVHKAAFVLPTFVERRLEQWNSAFDTKADDGEEVDRCFLQNCTIS